MNTILKKQEVAQGVKLGSFKEFQTLNSNELKGIEGGSPWIERAWKWMQRHIRFGVQSHRGGPNGYTTYYTIGFQG